MADDGDDDDVGYGKPPKHSRFKPGELGNPKGRTKGARGLRAEFRRELDEKIEINVHGKPRKLSKRQLVMKSLVAKAAQGEIRAANLVLQFIIQFEGLDDRRSSRTGLSAADERILVSAWRQAA